MTATSTIQFALSRRSAMISAGLLSLAAVTSLPRGTAAHGQDADPLAGATIEQLSAGMPALVPGHALVLLRVTMEPGTILAAHSHPGPVALHVEQGLFGTEFVEGAGTVQPAPQGGTPTPAIEVAAGDDIQMPAGDALFYDGAVHTMRNDGDEPVVLLIAALFDASAPGFQWQEAATPVASRIGVTQ
jgi:quercetin dioxygenase-like cupin family protein